MSRGKLLLNRIEQNRKTRTKGNLLAHPKTERLVYFIQVGEGGPIKIGSGCSPEERLRHLQIANPYQLHLRLTIPGSELEEKALHAIFGQARIRGEWFEPTTPLLEFLAEPPKDLAAWCAERR